jgi:periplasmic protein TonB
LDIEQDKSESPNDSIAPRALSERARSHAASFAVSLMAHAAALAMIIYLVPAIEHPHSEVLAYLVEVRDGSPGSSARAGAGPSMPIHSEIGPLIPHKRSHRSARITHPDRDHEAKPPDTAIASLKPTDPAPIPRDLARDPHAPASSSGTSNAPSSSAPPTGAGGDATTGSGSRSTDGAGNGDGDGTSIAHADYGNNPPPIYPTIARRRAQQGTVTLHVLVGIDGIVQRVEIAESSGFDALDDAALETVRRRWRFIPARRSGLPIESWVLVPIRFALTEANAAR